MTDLIQRLHERDLEDDPIYPGIYGEAAAEIERLRAANESVAVCAKHVAGVTRGDCLVCEIERLRDQLSFMTRECQKFEAVVDACVYSYGDNADRMCALCHVLNGHESDCPIAALKEADDE